MKKFSFQKDSNFQNIPRLETSKSTINPSSIKELFFQSITKSWPRIIESLILNDYVSLSELRDNDENTGLLLSTIHSNIHIAKIILKYCPELIEYKNKQGVDALSVSIYNNDNLMFFLLINNISSSLNFLSNINELCRLAVRNENLEILQFLTASKTYIEDPYLLHYACAQKNLQIFNYILNLCKSFDEKDSHGETPLHWAVMRGSYHIVLSLLKIYKENRLNINEKSKNGITPFHLALLKQDKNLVQLIFEQGGDINEVDQEGNSIIHMLAAIGDLKWLKYIIKNFDAHCFQKNNLGNTPLISAILNGRNEVVEYFLEFLKPNLNWKNKFGQTPLHAAIFSNQVKIVELLLKYKADLTVKDVNDLTPYHYAYVEKKTEMIKIIHSVLNLEK
jgi:ankyrin repeat protein